MEDRGYEVSDIIMIDSKMKCMELIDSTEIDDRVIEQLLLEHAPELYKEVLTAHPIKDKVFRRIRAYHIYLSKLINTGTVNAKIHGLVAEGLELGKASDNALLWKQSTEKHYVEYELLGEHFELLEPGFVELNAELIQRILKEIFDQSNQMGIIHQ
ncbi:Plipastatin synthase subunit E [compost metagenome]